MPTPEVRFGTDGVRGEANDSLTAEVALAVGRAAARLSSGSVLIGRDTRRSGPMLESAVAAGVCAEGSDAVLLGVVPTPAVAVASAALDTVGLVISASHNPFADNGLKLFAAGGRKLSDDEQAAVEASIADVLVAGGLPGPTGAGVGEVRTDPLAFDRYADAVTAALADRRLDGLRLVVDCAHGANSEVAPTVFARLGADITVVAAEPDGTNINDGVGSTHPETLAAAVVEAGADLGVAFDGDADRLLAVDGAGRLVDGDQLMALFAADLSERGALRNNTVVVTVMSNLGFHHAMRRAEIDVVTTAVGDRYVLEAMNAGGFSLGGEQSGHLIFSDHATTGDGLLSAVLLCDLVLRSGQPLTELADASMTRFPQVLRNVRIERSAADVVEAVAPSVAAATAQLGDSGRVLLRPSGTEPLVRVMVEAPSSAEAEAVAATLVAAVEAAR
ncbi:MAG: phosphoglucosamine mutase [Actinobacteria bacterium]|nr:phosphoglucosamine mutase [Actinomycetota bacterium]